MSDGKLAFIAAVFALAGLTKGVIGLGLPTISMGLLAIVMTPLQAAAILVLPSFLTNIWQMAAGPSLWSCVRRLWPMLAGLCAGTWAGDGLMTGSRYDSLFLGLSLVIYAGTGFRPAGFTIAKTYEPWLGPAVGVATGIVTAATGVFVIPAVPYLQSIALQKEEFIQALGLAFTVSTIALAVNLFGAGALNFGATVPTLVALMAAIAGMWIGRALRLRLSPAMFRRFFFVGLLLLGIYLIGNSLR